MAGQFGLDGGVIEHVGMHQLAQLVAEGVVEAGLQPVLAEQAGVGRGAADGGHPGDVGGHQAFAQHALSDHSGRAKQDDF